MYEIILKQDGNVIAEMKTENIEIDGHCDAVEVPDFPGNGPWRRYEPGAATTVLTIHHAPPKNPEQQPFCNSAGEPFDPPPEIDRSEWVQENGRWKTQKVKTDPTSGCAFVMNSFEIEIPDSHCPDCHGTRQYQPLTGPAEPCKTCCGGAG